MLFIEVGICLADLVTALSRLYRTYKPELVPENVKSFSREAAFKSLLPGFKHMLEAAHERLQSENNNLRAKNKGMDWTAVTFNKVRLTSLVS